MKFRFVDFQARFYNGLKNLEDEFVGLVSPGDVHDLHEAPADGRWVEDEKTPVVEDDPETPPAVTPPPVVPVPVPPAPTPAPAATAQPVQAPPAQ